MPHTFSNIGNAAEFVGRTPWSARVPLDPLFARRVRPVDNRDRPTRASAADRGGRPTTYAGVRLREKYVAQAGMPAPRRWRSLKPLWNGAAHPNAALPAKEAPAFCICDATLLPLGPLRRLGAPPRSAG